MTDDPYAAVWLDWPPQITRSGGEPPTTYFYAPSVVWLVAAALVAQIVTAIVAAWRNPTL
jgi:hypothetical protein